MTLLMPDIDAAVVAFLRDHPQLAPLHAGRVSTRTVAAGVCLRVTNLGGRRPAARPWEVESQVSVEAWGGTDQEATTLARTVTAVSYDLAGPVAGGYVSAAWPTLEPISQPDPDSGRARFLVQITVRAHPEAS